MWLRRGARRANVICGSWTSQGAALDCEGTARPTLGTDKWVKRSWGGGEHGNSRRPKCHPFAEVGTPRLSARTALN
eukprot:11456628-Alexandrium_andersonii.AAC.1